MLFTYLVCVVFQGKLQGQIGMVPSNFTNIIPNAIIIEGEYRMLYVVNERLRGECGMDCNFQASEEEGPGCHTAFAALVSPI